MVFMKMPHKYTPWLLKSKKKIERQTAHPATADNTPSSRASIHPQLKPHKAKLADWHHHAMQLCKLPDWVYTRQFYGCCHLGKRRIPKAKGVQNRLPVMAIHQFLIRPSVRPILKFCSDLAMMSYSKMCSVKKSGQIGVCWCVRTSHFG